MPKNATNTIPRSGADSLLRYSHSLDVIENELDALHKAWQELLPAARRPGSPTALIVAEIVDAVDMLRRVRRGVVREAEL